MLHPGGVKGRIRGWAVVGADGGKIGTVHDLLEDSTLVVELDPTTLAGHLRIDSGDRLNDRTRLPGGTTPGADVDPTVGETRLTEFLAPGARQHAGEHPAAVPRDRTPDTDAPPAPPRVRIPWNAALLKEDDHQVVLETLRSADVPDLPAYLPAEEPARR
jgi:hypothetical protein